MVGIFLIKGPELLVVILGMPNISLLLSQGPTIPTGRDNQNIYPDYKTKIIMHEVTPLTASISSKLPKIIKINLK